MMTKEKSPVIRQVRYLLTLPLAIFLLLFFSSQEKGFSQEKKNAAEIAPPPPPPPPPVGDEPNFTTNAAGEIVYFTVDQMPEFQGGGVEKAREYVMKNVVYPETAKKSHLGGKVYIQWIVDETGKVVDVTVVKMVIKEKDKEKAIVVVGHAEEEKKVSQNAIGELETEAVRVISSMPAWKSGKLKGNPVKVQYTMPIVFNLQEK